MIKKRCPLGSLIGDAIKSFEINKDNIKDRNLGIGNKIPEKEINTSADTVKSRNISFSQPIKHQKSMNINDVYVKWFPELSNKDVQIAGGKGASLSEMYNNKFPVPPGFIISAQSFDYFLTKNNIKDKIKKAVKSIDIENTEELTKASKQIRTLIESQEIPENLKEEIVEAYKILSTEKINTKISEDTLNILKNSYEPIFVSVRSSATTEDLATASFAGQQESFLNVKGERSLIEYIKKCFSSLYTPRAIYYRSKQGFSEDEALLAVVVQKMIDSEKSGVVFSKSPTGFSDNIVIEAVFGLGEGIVSGMIKPDHYIVSKELEIKDVQISEKKVAVVRTSSGNNEIVKLTPAKATRQVLTNAEIVEIAHYALRLEEHYKKPQDIEFALESGKAYITQSRPITTIKKLSSKTLSGTPILTGLGASPGIGLGVVKIIKDMSDLHKIKNGDVLVTEMTNPDMVVAMQKSSAIVTDEGGTTSHAAIVSREMGIPAVVGTIKATSLLKEGMKITVDGYNGKVYEGEVAESQTVEIKPVVKTERIKLKIILDIPEYAERASQSGIKEIGLVRLEGIIASSGKHPLSYEKDNNFEGYSLLLFDGLKKMARYFNKMWIRSSDIRTDEYSSLKGAPEREINPMLGFHGVRFSLKHPSILKAELEAIKRLAETYPEKRFGIMFPQIISIEEVKECKKYFNDVKRDNMEFGVMIETPAAVQIIEDISNEVDFISFGTNDLTQFTLAVDRGEDNVQYLYNELHPAVLSQIKKVIDVCRRKRVETSICGQAGSKKEMVEFLFRKGINSISVNADAAQEISQLIKSFEEEWKKRKEEFEKQTKKENDKTVNYKDFKLRNKKNKKHWKKWDKRGGIQNPEQKINSTQNQTQDKNKNKILSDIKIQAEFEDIKLAQDDKGIEPFNDLDRIEQKSEEINKKIQAEKEEDIKEMQKTEDNIILKEKRLHQIIPEETIKENKNEEMPQPAIKKVPDEKIMEEIDNVLAKTKDFPDSEDIFEETGILNSDDENNKK